MLSRVEQDRQNARVCAEMAHNASDPHLRRTFLELQNLWLERVGEAEERPLWRKIIARGPAR